MQNKVRRILIISAAVYLGALGLFFRIFVRLQRPIDRLGWGLSIAGILCVPVIESPT